MVVTTGPDDAALVSGLVQWLSARRGLSDAAVGDLRRPSAGYSSETVFVDIAWTAEGVAHRDALVIRMAPSVSGTFPRYDLFSQWRAQVAAAANVPVADPELEQDARWLGAPFMVMPRVDGHIIGALAHRDRWLTARSRAEQALVHANFLATLAGIHRSDPDLATGVPRRDNGDELDFWEEYLMWSSAGAPVPVLVDGIEWCRRHRPPDEPPAALLWGDARFENMVIGDDFRPRAVLDWDMTSIGAPEHDLAWFTSLDLTAHRLFGERVAGFPGRAGTVALFEEYSGRPVRDLEWYETLAMVRSAAIMTRIGYLRRDAGEPLLLPIDDNPILDLVMSRLG
jgi:aminoglycoside phosphotransferase (APT) family kinase protein